MLKMREKLNEIKMKEMQLEWVNATYLSTYAYLKWKTSKKITFE